MTRPRRFLRATASPSSSRTAPSTSSCPPMTPSRLFEVVAPATVPRLPESAQALTNSDRRSLDVAPFQSLLQLNEPPQLAETHSYRPVSLLSDTRFHLGLDAFPTTCSTTTRLSYLIALQHAHHDGTSPNRTYIDLPPHSRSAPSLVIPPTPALAAMCPLPRQSCPSSRASQGSSARPRRSCRAWPTR